MLATKYESYSYKDWFEEFLDAIKSMLPTGLTLVAVFVQGGDPGNFKTTVPVITEVKLLAQNTLSLVRCYALLPLGESLSLSPALKNFKQMMLELEEAQIKTLKKSILKVENKIFKQ